MTAVLNENCADDDDSGDDNANDDEIYDDYDDNDNDNDDDKINDDLMPLLQSSMRIVRKPSSRAWNAVEAEN